MAHRWTARMLLLGLGSSVMACSGGAEVVDDVSPSPSPSEFEAQSPTEAPLPTVADSPPPTVVDSPPPTVAESPPPTVADSPPPTVAASPPPTVAESPPPTVPESPPPTATGSPLPTDSDSPSPTMANSPTAAPAVDTERPPGSPTPTPYAADTPTADDALSPSPTLDQEDTPDPWSTPEDPSVPWTSPTAASSPTPEPSGWPDAPYFLAVNGCDSGEVDCGDPGNHHVWLTTSDDGLSWQPIPDFAPYVGSVPDVIRRGDVIYLYSNEADLEADTDMPQVARFFADVGIWDPARDIAVRHPDGTVQSLVDGSFAIDESGNLVLFFLATEPGDGRASCPNGQESCTKYFKSATEVAGSQGLEYVVDEGTRVEVELTGGTASDPDIFKDPSGWVLYIARGTGIQVYVGDTLQDHFTLIGESDPSGYLSSIGGVSAGYYSEEGGEYWTYVAYWASSGASIALARHAELSQSIDTSFSVILETLPGVDVSDTMSFFSPGFAANEP